MKIFLIYPPWEEEETLAGYSRKMMKDVELITSPPLGLAYIAAVLKNEGHEVKIFDCQFIDQQISLFRNLRKETPDIAGLSLFTASVDSAFNLINKIKKIAPHVKIIVGGAHAGAAPQHCLSNKNIDIAVIGEGEITMKEICKGKALKNIDGIAYKFKGTIRFNKPRKFIENLDSLPFPARELLPNLFIYRTEIEKLSREPYTSMITSRGCPYHCSYCSKTVFGRVFRARSAKNVVDEMEHLIERYGVKHIHIYDDTFNANPKRVLEICDEIIKRKLDLTWDCEARVNTTNKNLLKKMADAGCTLIGFGVESADPKILKNLTKDVDLKKVENSVKWAREVGIRTRCYFIIGSPGETWDTVKKTIEFTKKLNPDFVLFSILTPFPGTKVFDWLKENKTIKEDEYVIRNVIQLGELTPEELKKALNLAYREFYMRPIVIFNHMKSINSFFMFKSYTRMGLSFFKKYFLEFTPLKFK